MLPHLKLTRCLPGCHIYLTIIQLTLQLCTVATHIHAQTNTQRVGKTLTDHVLRAQLLAMIVVVGLRSTESAHDEFTVSLDICQIKIFRHGDRVEHGTIGRDYPFLFGGTGGPLQNQS